jgi:hypothetical protein
LSDRAPFVMNYDFLDEQQIKSFRRSLPAALDYHFTNFQRLEISAVRMFDATWWNDTTLEERLEVAHALTNITFEVQAYLNQLRHVSYFLKSRQISQKIVGPPSQPGWREVYDSIMDQNGMIHMLANKWSAHRSYNSPRQEDINLHKEVLLNLSGGVTM